jgi:hypothetical protein
MISHKKRRISLEDIKNTIISFLVQKKFLKYMTENQKCINYKTEDQKRNKEKNGTVSASALS